MGSIDSAAIASLSGIARGAASNKKTFAQIYCKLMAKKSWGSGSNQNQMEELAKLMSHANRWQPRKKSWGEWLQAYEDQFWRCGLAAGATEIARDATKRRGVLEGIKHLPDTLTIRELSRNGTFDQATERIATWLDDIASSDSKPTWMEDGEEHPVHAIQKRERGATNDNNDDDEPNPKRPKGSSDEMKKAEAHIMKLEATLKELEVAKLEEEKTKMEEEKIHAMELKLEEKFNKELQALKAATKVGNGGFQQRQQRRNGGFQQQQQQQQQPICPPAGMSMQDTLALLAQMNKPNAPMIPNGPMNPFMAQPPPPANGQQQQGSQNQGGTNIEKRPPTPGGVHDNNQCYNCQGYGHISFNCPHPKQQRGAGRGGTPNQLAL